MNVDVNIVSEGLRAALKYVPENLCGQGESCPNPDYKKLKLACKECGVKSFEENEQNDLENSVALLKKKFRFKNKK